MWVLLTSALAWAWANDVVKPFLPLMVTALVGLTIWMINNFNTLVFRRELTWSSDDLRKAVREWIDRPRVSVEARSNDQVEWQYDTTIFREPNGVREPQTGMSILFRKNRRGYLELGVRADVDESHWRFFETLSDDERARILATLKTELLQFNTIYEGIQEPLRHINLTVLIPLLNGWLSRHTFVEGGAKLMNTHFIVSTVLEREFARARQAGAPAPLPPTSPEGVAKAIEREVQEDDSEPDSPSKDKDK